MLFRSSQLSRHFSIDRRLSLLAGPSNLLLYAYIDEADEIVYVPSLLYLFLYLAYGAALFLLFSSFDSFDSFDSLGS